MPPDFVIGWDIGGAHLKAAAVAGNNGRIKAVHQVPCELWKGLDRLESAVQAILALLPRGALDHHALTMTGELVDLFASRDDGISQIIKLISRLLPRDRLWIYAGRSGLIRVEEAVSLHYSDIASANWLASASWAAQKIGQGLFVDVGSTTTDVLVLAEGRVLAQGYSDYDRLVSKEMIYTGIVRTPVMAVAASVNDQGRDVGVMAEYFATMADVYRLTGELDERHDQSPAADCGEKSVTASAKRLARMLGCDYSEPELPRWRALADELRHRQLALILNACRRQLARIAIMDDAPIIGAGVGRFLAQAAAQKLGRPYQDFSALFTVDSNAPSHFSPADCAPAAAVACLALREIEKQTVRIRNASKKQKN